MYRGFLLPLVFLTASTALPAQNLLMVDQLSGDLYSMDPKSGSTNLIRTMPWSTDIWTGLATDSSGRVVVATFPTGPFTNFSELYEVEPTTGQLTYLVTVDNNGIGSLAFGPGDVLYAAINVNYPTNPEDYRLSTIDLATGITTEIGPMGDDAVLAMDYDGTDMYAWSLANGISRVDLATGQGTDVNPSFLGHLDLTVSMCFGDNGNLYFLDSALWTADPNSGVQSLVALNPISGIFGGVEYIPGPEQVISIWLSDQVGKSSFLECRGATPGAQVAVFYSQRPFGQTVIPNGFPCSGSTLDLNSANFQFAGLISADAQGSFSLGPKILPQQALYSLQLQALDLSSCTTSNPITVWF